jgi:hypothetical protein
MATKVLKKTAVKTGCKNQTLKKLFGVEVAKS